MAPAQKKSRKEESSQKSGILIGCHVSAAGGVQNTVENAVAVGARCFAMFLTNQRTWNYKPLEDSTVDAYKDAINASSVDPRAVLPHGIYLLNCGAPDPAILEKSRSRMIEEMKRCDRLGIVLYNIHPGSCLGKIERDQCIEAIATSVNEALAATEMVTLVLECMSGQKNVIGSDFKELSKIINLVKDKKRIGVCLDTCHMFAAGYDIRSPEAYKATMAKFDKEVGFKYLKALHLNDSKGELGCHSDRHEDIGRGKIGLEGFRCLVNDKRMIGLPMVLETPGFTSYDKQVKLLYSLIDH